MDFGMPTLIELPSIRENASLCSQLGLDFIELNMNLPYCQLSELTEDTLSAVQKDYGCCFTLHLDETLDPFCFNPLVAQAWRQTSLEAVDCALQCDISVINMHLQRGIYFTLPDRREFLYSTHRDAYLRSVVSFRDAVSQHIGTSGTLLCIENTDGFTGFQLEAIELMLEKDCFALTWDIGHSFCTGEKDMEFITAVRPERVKHMHFHDAAGKSPHLPLGEGGIALSDRLSFARRNDCRCVIEVKTAEALTRSVEYLKSSLM